MSERVNALAHSQAGGVCDKIALVGCGAVSEILYAPALKRLLAEGAIRELFVVDRSPQRAERICSHLPSASGHADLSEISADLADGLVIVALPPHLHAAATIKAIEAGGHVLCEKPMGRTVAECDAMLAAASAAGRLIAVGHFRRFFPVTRLIRDWIKEEHLGRLRSFRFLEGEIYSWPAASAFSFNRETAGGGVLMDSGVHTLDLLLWWMGPVAELVYSDDAAGGVEANCVVKFRMQSGASGYLQMSWDWPLANQYFFEFEKGWLLYTCDIVDSFQWAWHADSLVQRVKLENGDVKAAFDHLPRSTGVASTLGQCFVLQLSNVLAAIRGSEPLVCPGSDGRSAVALVERCYNESGALDQPWLPKKEQLKFDALARRPRSMT